jgi:hypothetical protein
MSNHIRSIVEDRVAAYLAAALPTVTVHKGVTDELRVIPIVVAHASDAIRPYSLGAHNLGNYRVTLKVYVYSSADDETLQTHRDRVALVHGALSDDTSLKEAWGAEATYGTLYDIWAESDNEGMAQRRYGNVLTYTLMACMPQS